MIVSTLTFLVARSGSILQHLYSTHSSKDEGSLDYVPTRRSSLRTATSAHGLHESHMSPPRTVLPSMQPSKDLALGSGDRATTLKHNGDEGYARLAQRKNNATTSLGEDGRREPGLCANNRTGTREQSVIHNGHGQAPPSSLFAEPAGSGVSVRFPPTTLDAQTCFAIVMRQVAGVLEAGQAGVDTSGIAHNDALPLQAPITVDPATWSNARKWTYTLFASLTMFNGSFASTAPNGAGTYMVQQYGLSNEEMVFIATSFVGGCVAGPILWAPLSEIYGRRVVFLTSTLLYAVTNVGCALAPNKTTLFLCRFLAGAFASSAFSNAAAMITDLFAPMDRAKPMIVVSLAPLLGPCFGPLFGSVVSLKLRWPFVFWFLGAIGLLLEVMLFFVPETYLPVILRSDKSRASMRSGVTQRQRIRTFVTVNLGRPLNMMCREPIVTCATFYLSFFFALMYVFFASWPLIFGPPGIYKLDTVHTGITFLPIGLGGISAAALLPLCERYYLQRSKAAGEAVPEARLLPTFFVGPLVAFGLLWAGWLGRPRIPYEVAMLAGVPIGAAMVLVFQGWIGYLGDCYRLYSSSAIAATVIGRSLSGATIPLCTHRLHEKLDGIAYLYTMLAGLVALTTPIPYIVFRYGARLRSRSMYKPGRA